MDDDAVANQVATTDAAPIRVTLSAAQLAEAQSVGRVGSWEWDVATGQVTWTPEQYRLFGVDPDGFTPSFEGFLELVYPQDRSRVRAAIEQSLGTGDDYEVEHRLELPERGLRTFLCRGRLFGDRDGRPVRMLGVSVDITDHIERDSELRVREAQLRAAQWLSDVGTFEWDVITDQVTWSEGLGRIFGIAMDRVPETFDEYLALLHPEDRRERQALIEQVRAEGGSLESEYRIVRGDGEIRWIRSRLSAVAEDAERVTRIVGACRDVTDERRSAGPRR
jgi:PAS domain S-box-containing protein